MNCSDQFRIQESWVILVCIYLYCNYTILRTLMNINSCKLVNLSQRWIGITQLRKNCWLNGLSANCSSQFSGNDGELPDSIILDHFSRWWISGGSCWWFSLSLELNIIIGVHSKQYHSVDCCGTATDVTGAIPTQKDASSTKCFFEGYWGSKSLLLYGNRPHFLV